MAQAPAAPAPGAHDEPKHDAPAPAGH
jgi:hypothetical protein